MSHVLERSDGERSRALGEDDARQFATGVPLGTYESHQPFIERLMAGEKLTEWQVTAAFQRVRAGANIDAERFVLAPAFGDTPHYKLYLETRPGHRPAVGSALDAALSQLNMENESKRRSNRLGPVETVHLPPDCLIAREHRLQADRRTTGEQYKHKYLLTIPGENEDLQDAASEVAQAGGSAGSSIAPD